MRTTDVLAQINRSKFAHIWRDGAALCGYEFKTTLLQRAYADDPLCPRCARADQ